jgi:hypothetical protein
MLGFPGLRVLEVEEGVGEVVVRVESTQAKAWCRSCRRRAEAQDRVEVHLRGAHCFRRPARLVLVKGRLRCRQRGCVAKTWTERIAGIAPRQVLTLGAGMEVCRQVGRLCRPVASVADEYGVSWDTRLGGGGLAWPAPGWTALGGSVGCGRSVSMSTRSWPLTGSTGPSTPPAWLTWTAAW